MATQNLTLDDAYAAAPVVDEATLTMNAEVWALTLNDVYAAAPSIELPTARDTSSPETLTLDDVYADTPSVDEPTLSYGGIDALTLDDAYADTPAVDQPTLSTTAPKVLTLDDVYATVPTIDEPTLSGGWMTLDDVYARVPVVEQAILSITAGMNTLSTLPERTNYSTKRDATLSVLFDVEGGLPRVRKDKDSVGELAVAEWLLEDDEYSDFIDFFDANHSVPFIATLIGPSGGYSTYVVRYVHGTLQMTQGSATMYTVAATLEIWYEHV